MLRQRSLPKLPAWLGDQQTRVVRGDERAKMQQAHDDLEASMLRRKK